MNADHQGSAPSFEEDSGVLGVKKELNCVPILLRLMQKGVYSSYTLLLPASMLLAIIPSAYGYPAMPMA
jgi:hypothetical protein